MPTISMFYGIKIYIPPKDHNPPHFHVEYAEFQAQVEIKTGNILAGQLPPRARALTEEWRMLNLDLLLENWQLMVESKNTKPIKGLV